MAIACTGLTSRRAGHRFNPNKVLLDPYAKQIARELIWNDAILDPQADTAPYAPLARVAEHTPEAPLDSLPNTPWHETVIYELHVKGFTQQHPDVPEKLRGTYAGLASVAAIGHFRKLGITAIELLPVHYHVDEHFLVARGRTNYWGYNTLGYFAPDPRYAVTGARGAVREFREMVRHLHAAEIEVILDVVYNHTGEGNEHGPTLSFRGIDNAAYYRLDTDLARYVDFTGCGNSLNVAHPRTLQLIMDSLRHWVTEMHVDGFRFDLASVLARDLWEVDRLSSFFDIIQQDPVLSAGEADRGAVGRRRRAAIRSATSPCSGVSGTASIAIVSGVSGKATAAPSARSPRGSRGAATCSPMTAGTPARASTSSRRTTASRCATSSATTRSTTKRTARKTATAATTTTAGIAALKA